MRVVFPAYSMKNFDWHRICAVLKPIAEHVDLQVFYSDPVHTHANWAKFVQVPPFCNLHNLDAVLKYAVKIISKLDDFDLLYCFTGGPYYQMLSVAIAQLTQKPIVMHVNGDGKLARELVLQKFSAVLEDAADRISLNNVDLLVPISSILEKKLRRRVKDPTRICKPVPFTVDTTRFKPLLFPENMTVGYSGRLSPEKGSKFMFKLMESTPKQHFKVAGPIQTEVRFPENTHYTGCLPYGDMVYFVNSCSVVMLPSFGEGMPGAILEAYACGRPVIVTPESRPSELPLFGWEAPHDLQQWKLIIENLNMADIQSRGIKARSWITSEWHSWTGFGEKMKAVFDSVT